MKVWSIIRLITLASTMCYMHNGISGVRLDKKNVNQLHRVFHHKTVGSDVDKPLTHMELGQVVFYFSQEPIVNKIPHLGHNNDASIELFFPGAELKGISQDELEKKMIDSATKNIIYQVHLERVATPINGVKCTIRYDKNRVAFDYDMFLSISDQHGVRLHFFNKQLLNKMGKENALLRTACTKKKVVIDCGHGGKDAGAIGAGHVLEKDITLSVGLEVAALLRKRGFDVTMTRESDRELALDERTSCANAAQNAQAFVSIHANSSKDPNSRGFETFYASDDLFKKKHIPDVRAHRIIIDEHQKMLSQKSMKLAQVLHTTILGSMNDKQIMYDRQVKSGAAQVLIGSRIPSALIEIGFISNPHEANLLADKRYQRVLAQGICEGVVAYCSSYQI